MDEPGGHYAKRNEAVTKDKHGMIPLTRRTLSSQFVETERRVVARGEENGEGLFSGHGVETLSSFSLGKMKKQFQREMAVMVAQQCKTLVNSPRHDGATDGTRILKLVMFKLKSPL